MRLSQVPASGDMPDSMSASNLNVLTSLGVVKRVKPTDGNRSTIYELISDPGSATNWTDMTLTTRKVLDCIVREFGTRPFNLQALGPATGLSAKNLVPYIKALGLRSIVQASPSSQRRKIYSLAVPVEEAVEHLCEYGFDYIALVG